MKKNYGMIFFALIFIISVTIFCSYNLSKTRFLHLEFAPLGKKMDVKQIKITPGIEIDGYSDKKNEEATLITDEFVIEQIINYLNSIPLVPVSIDELPANANRGGMIVFYGENGIQMGDISFKGEKYLIRSFDSKAFKVKNDEIYLISGLEDLFGAI